MYFIGLDIGSTMTKCVIVDENKEIVTYLLGPTGAEHRRRANVVTVAALEKAGLSLSHIARIVATGYGRVNVPFADNQITEITCHAKGISHLFPQARTIIDIGGQDSKGIRIKKGKVMDFVMNDKCAAGTGRFLEIIADIMGVEVAMLADMALKGENKIISSNICSVYAAQEVLKQLARGMKEEDIAAGLHKGMATRICNMLNRMNIQEAVIITGGCAKNTALRKEIETCLDKPVLCPEEPLITGALGAALMGRKKALEDAEIEKAPLKRKMHLGEVCLYE